MRGCRSLRPIITVLVVLAAASFKPASAQDVGTAAAVNPSAQARGAGGSRTIVIGQSIAHRERIQTASAGSVQLLFLDKTSMTVGPNSDLSIDEYVYDPTTNTGKLAATLTKGVMRFVGGQISHAGNAQVATPNAVVGIRGGVGIFQPNSVYLGYGQGQVTSGSSTVTLDAGEYTQTAGGGAPPSPPGPPPAGFLQSVLAALQSQPGQGGGARASTGQVNAARRAASGSSTGTIATNVQNVANNTIYTAALNNLYGIYLQSRPQSLRPAQRTLSRGISLRGRRSIRRVPIRRPIRHVPIRRSIRHVPIRRSICRASIPQSSFPRPLPPGGSQLAQTLFGYTGGVIQSIGQNGSLGQTFPAFGVTLLQVDAAGNNAQANFSIASSARPSQNSLQVGSIQFGSVDQSLPSGRVSISEFDQLVGPAQALQPAVGSNGKPLSSVNGQTLTRHEGLFVEMKPGSQLTNALANRVGTSFCQCDYTRWGLWDSQSSRPGPNNSTIDERSRMFWVAGRLPNLSDVPATGTASYTGHAIANIRNGSQNYVAAGAFQNVVDFGTRSGNVSVTGFDSTNYAGQVSMGSSDPRFFAGTLSGVNNQSRNMALTGNFFAGTASPVAEMGGALQVTGPSYSGAGIFVGRR